MLVIFAAFFTVLLGLGAFALDQSLWLDRRRESQKDADTAVLGGAQVYLADVNGLSEAEVQASKVAEKNGVDTTNPQTTFVADQDCTDFRGDVTDGVPSIHAEINRPTSSLFARFFGIDGLQDLGAQATACVGEPEELQGIDPFYIAPGTSSPDPLCFNDDGTVKLGTICPIVVSGTYGDAGQRGKLSLQDDPDDPSVNPSCDPFSVNNCQTYCTQQFNSDSDELVVEGSPAICVVDDGVYTSGGTYATQKGAIACRIFGVDDPDCPNALDDLDQPGEGYCDDEFNDSSAQIPPFGGTAASGLDPAFDPDDVIDSPPGVDDFTEAFSKPSGGPPDSYTDPQFLIPNICNGRTSPRIWTIIIGEEPPPPGGVLRVDQFAIFFVLGCWEQEAPGSTVLSGPIDPFCDPTTGSTTNLVGVFVRAFLPTGGGHLEPCDPDEGCIGQSIVLVK
jgi:hypothetical protein